MPTYVTVSELRGQAPNDTLDTHDDDTLTRLAAHASRIIRTHTRAAVYYTDQDGMPTFGPIRDAMRDATAAQVIAWAEAGMLGDVLTGGVKAEARVASSSINGASVNLDHTQADAARLHLYAGGLGVEAMLILDDAGLINALPGVYR